MLKFFFDTHEINKYEQNPNFNLTDRVLVCLMLLAVTNQNLLFKLGLQI